MRFFFAHPVLPSVRARSARVGTGERESGRVWGQQLVVRGQLHLPTVKLVMRVARVAPKRARCFNSKGTSFHVVLELEHVKPVDQRSAIRKADAVLPAFARAGQRHDTLKRVAQRGRCRLLYLFGVKHVSYEQTTHTVHSGYSQPLSLCLPCSLHRQLPALVCTKLRSKAQGRSHQCASQLRW